MTLQIPLKQRFRLPTKLSIDCELRSSLPENKRQLKTDNYSFLTTKCNEPAPDHASVILKFSRKFQRKFNLHTRKELVKFLSEHSLILTDWLIDLKNPPTSHKKRTAHDLQLVILDARTDTADYKYELTIKKLTKDQFKPEDWLMYQNIKDWYLLFR